MAMDASPTSIQFINPSICLNAAIKPSLCASDLTGRNELLGSGRRTECVWSGPASLSAGEHPVFSASIMFPAQNAARIVTSDYWRHALLALHGTSWCSHCQTVTACGLGCSIAQSRYWSGTGEHSNRPRVASEPNIPL